MPQDFIRSAMLLGDDNISRLAESKVAVFGIGGVGSYAVEALARSGIGSLLLVDHDTIAGSNINRQLHADTTTIGLYKTKVMAERVLRINPNATVETREVFCSLDNIDELLTGVPDYLLDAVDTVTAKLAIIAYGKEHGIPVISCMGAGNKLDPSRFRVSDIYDTTDCPLCRVMRRELRRLGVDALKVVWSDETPLSPAAVQNETKNGRPAPGSVAFVPPVSGLIAAGEIVREICRIRR